jgi:hypothetical protein
MTAPRDPATPEQWQVVVNLAQACLLLDDSRLYGLIQGGPDIDRARCLDILARGKAQGWVPRSLNDIETLALKLVSAING